ncbi:4'-phosphopantetheinyl transferase family protein [Neptunicella sp. SCSIO 80796]|uniref:4'-phosphopantetheinyl transferase family protein n=1 Tax=Neptunicella plasticusilytica TaxID=3117012 RepID=UPI003A4E5564
MTADYSNHYQHFAPAGCSENQQPISVHILEMKSEQDFDSRHLHELEKRVLANKKTKNAKMQYLVSRTFVKALYLSESACWNQYQLKYLPEQHAVCLFAKNNVVKKLSLSHSKNWIAVLDVPKGTGAIDIQYHSKSAVSIATMQKSFAPADQQLLQQNQHSFFDLWTIKEAYAKLKNLSIFEVLTIPVNEIEQHCYIEIIPLHKKISIALALRPDIHHNKAIFRWTTNKKGEFVLANSP